MTFLSSLTQTPAIDTIKMHFAFSEQEAWGLLLLQ